MFVPFEGLSGMHLIRSNADSNGCQNSQDGHERYSETRSVLLPRVESFVNRSVRRVLCMNVCVGKFRLHLIRELSLCLGRLFVQQLGNRLDAPTKVGEGTTR